MKDITMKKSVLLEKLRENQKAHKAVFDEAVVGYKKQALALLEQQVQCSSPPTQPNSRRACRNSSRRCVEAETEEPIITPIR